MAENKTFRIFHRKKKEKKTEKGHREPIVVRMFNSDISGTNVSFAEKEVEGTSHSDNNENDHSEGERKHRRFEPNNKYFTIMMYGLMFIFFAGIIVTCILKLASITEFIKGLLSVLAPFLIGAILAFIMNPIVSGIENGLFQGLFKMKNAKVRFVLSIILSYVLVLGLITFGMTRLGPQLGESISDLIKQSGALYNKAIELAGSLAEKFPSIDLSGIIDKVAASMPKIIEKLTDSATDILPTIFNTSVAIVKGVFNGLLGIAVSIYMVCDKRRIARAATSLVYAILPTKKAKPFIDTSKECFQIFGGFIIGKALDSLIIGIICFIVLTILKLPYTVLISVIVGVTNMIPFFGPFIGAIPGGIIYLCIDPVYCLIFAIAILAIQQFDGWILGPMILGDSTGIRPIWVIFGITFFGAYFGFIGMFLGVPFTAVIVYLIEKALNKKLNKKGIEIT